MGLTTMNITTLSRALLLTSLTLALGACSPVARRLRALEATLTGRALDGRFGEALAEAHLDDV